MLKIVNPLAISSNALMNLLETFPDNAKVFGCAEGLIVMTSDAEEKLVILNAPLCVPDQNPLSESVGSTSRRGIRLVSNADE
jgi:hypothetical protein